MATGGDPDASRVAASQEVGVGRVLLMVDAGFLLKALAFQVGADSRANLLADFAPISDVLADVVEDATGHRPTRQIWYDAANDARPRAEHRALASIPGVQVRLGWIALANGRPVQKAVDSLIVRDMLRTAYRGAADTVVLLSGDGDLVPGAQELVDFGIGFHLWGVALDDPRVRQSRELIEVADARLALDVADLVPFARLRGSSQADASESASTPDDIPPDVTGTGAAPGAEVQSSDPDSETQAESALAVLTPVRTGAPSLRQMSTPEAIAEDQLTDQIDDVSAMEAGFRYGQRWADLIERSTLERFLAQYTRPKMPRRIDLDLLWYIEARGRDVDDEAERRGARNGFWDAIERLVAEPVDAEELPNESGPASD